MNNNEGAEVHALCLISGGLDGLLAASLLREQGVRVHALTFSHPLSDPRPAEAAALRLGLPHRVEDFSGPFVKVLRGLADAPGTAPCMACHQEMLTQARLIMEREGWHFLCGGFVLDQHPPAQTLAAFERLDKAAGCSGRLLRPLSAQCLPPTKPEREGWVDRARLAGIRGTSRQGQAELAERLQLPGPFPATPACSLLDERLAARLHDLLQHEGVNGARSLQLLRLGRHFRVGPAAKFVLGRNEHENMRLEGMTELYDLLISAADSRGPSGLLPFTATDQEVKTAAAICLRYSDVAGGVPARVRVRSPRASRWLDTAPASPEEAARYRIDAVPVP